MRKTYREPIALCPLSTRVDAVYYGNDGQIFRDPMLALALYRPRDLHTNQKIESGDEAGNEIGFVECDRSGFFELDVEKAENFLGFEYDGVQVDWGKEIARLKEKREKRS
jgi:hypothetical protein